MTENRKASFWMKKLSRLDSLIYALRVHAIKKYCACDGKVIMDVWCWYNAIFLSYLNQHYKPKTSIALDLHLHKKHLEEANIVCIEWDLNKKNTIPEKVDIIFATAILEHLEKPVDFLRHQYEALAPWWQLVLTTPSVWSQPVLEFLAYKIHIISEDEIRDHKEYYDRKKLLEYCTQAWFDVKDIHHSYFELYMNNLIVAKKK